MKDVGPTWEKCRLVGPGIAKGREENIKETLINKLTFSEEHVTGVCPPYCGVVMVVRVLLQYVI